MKKHRSKIRQTRRLAVAVRDGCGYWLWGHNGPIWLYRCRVCERLILRGEATGGHIVPLSEGGSNEDSNLRLECSRCNGLDNVRRNVADPAKSSLRLVNGLRNARRKRLAKITKTRVFHNIPVYFDGKLLSFTCDRRANHLVRTGRAAQSTDGGVQLLGPPSRNDPARTEPVENACVRCGSTEYLRPFFIYPSWHPKSRTMRPTEAIRPVCIDCFETFAIIYAIEITRVARESILNSWSIFRDARTRKARALEAWSRLRAGKEMPAALTEYAKAEFAIDLRHTSVDVLRALADRAGGDLLDARAGLFTAVARATHTSGLDFPALHSRIARDEISVSSLEIPALPMVVCRSELKEHSYHRDMRIPGSELSA